MAGGALMVQITLLVGYIPDPDGPARTGLRWSFKEHWSGESATFVACGLRLWVKDYDGDRSGWTLKRGRELLAEGEDGGWDPYHFDACLTAAQAALRGAVAARKAELLRLRDARLGAAILEGEDHG
jgi:hypothetical protein